MTNNRAEDIPFPEDDIKAQESTTTSSSTQGGETSNIVKFPENYRIYGKSAALCVYAQTQKKKDLTKAYVHIEGAPGANKDFDWANKKINLQLTLKELPQFTATLLSFTNKFEAKNHGPANNKFMSMEAQANNHYIKMSMPEVNIAIPVAQEDTFYLADICLKVLIDNSRIKTSAVDMMAILKRTISK